VVGLLVLTQLSFVPFAELGLSDSEANEMSAQIEGDQRIIG
jgi:hypothetical protein